MVMINTGKLAGRTLFITGASRGIGKAIALKAARDGANIVIAAKTYKPHRRLKGTIYTVARKIEEYGGQCLPCVVDVQSDAQVKSAVDLAVREFGGIDILVNNASSFHLTSTWNTPMKRYDLMHNISVRGTFLVSKFCIPHLKKSVNAHILNISPPLIMDPCWFQKHLAYTMAKYGMSMCVLGMAEELKSKNISVNALWSKTAIATASMEFLGGKAILQNCRKSDIMADAAYAILTQYPPQTGQFFIDESVLRSHGIEDFSEYESDPFQPLIGNLFLPDDELQTLPSGALEFHQATKKPSPAKSIDCSVGDMFFKVQTVLNTNKVQQAPGVYSFIIKDVEEHWYLDMTSGSGTMCRGKPLSQKPDVTLIMNVESFYELFNGSIKPTTAFLSGKVKLKGNTTAAMTFERIFNEILTKLHEV